MQALSGRIAELDLDANIHAFESGEQLLETMKSGLCPDICFMDIYLKALSGIETARIVREASPGAALIFTTSSPDFYAEGFDLGAVHYLLKPIDGEKLDAAFGRALSSAQAETRHIKVVVNRQTMKIRLADIIHIEATGKLCLIYKKHITDPLKTYIKLHDLEAQLSSPKFLRCHQSYIVNLDEVSAPTEDGCFLMRNGIKVPIRQRSCKAIISEYNEYYFDKSRRGLL